MLGLRLDADPVGPEAPGAITAEHGPHHADQVQHAGYVTHSGVRPVDVTVQELDGFRDLVVDLEHRGDGHQDQEREVDEGVHDAGSGVAQQRLHEHTGTEVAEAPLGVAGVGGSVVGGATLPVLDPLGEQHGSVDDQHRDDRVEGQLQRPGHVYEHLAGDRRVVVESVHQRGDAGSGGEQGHEDPEADDGVVGTEALRVHGSPRLPVWSCPVWHEPGSHRDGRWSG